MIGVLGHQHLCQQARCRDAFVDDVGGHRCLCEGLALRAGPLAPDVALHCEDAGHVVQLLGHILANALELATALACRGRGFVADLASWQIGRQRRALGLLVGDRLRRAQLPDLMLNGRQIAVEFFFQQVALLGAVALGLGRELQPLEQCAFIGELLVQSPLVTQFGQQALADLAQLLCIQFAQGLLVDHHGQQCARACRARPLAHLPIAATTPSQGRFRSR